MASWRVQMHTTWQFPPDSHVSEEAPIYAVFNERPGPNEGTGYIALINDEATARIMAAAPELVEALRALLDDTRLTGYQSYASSVTARALLTRLGQSDG